MTIPPLTGPFSKRLRKHLDLIADAVNALTEGAVMPETTSGPHEIGQYVGDPSNGDFIGFQNDDVSARLTANLNGGRVNAIVDVSAQRALLRWSGVDTYAVQIDAEGLKLDGIPTSDPHAWGALWDDDGTVKRSHG